MVANQGLYGLPPGVQQAYSGSADEYWEPGVWHMQFFPNYTYSFFAGTLSRILVRKPIGATKLTGMAVKVTVAATLGGGGTYVRCALRVRRPGLANAPRGVLIDGSIAVDVTSTGIKEVSGLLIDVSKFTAVQLEQEVIYDVYPGSQATLTAYSAVLGGAKAGQPFGSSQHAFDGSSYGQSNSTAYPYAIAIATQWGV